MSSQRGGREARREKQRLGGRSRDWGKPLSPSATLILTPCDLDLSGKDLSGSASGWVGISPAVSALLFSGGQNFPPIFSVHSSKKLGHLQSAFFPKRWFLLTWVYVVTVAGTLASALADKQGWRLWGHTGRRLPQGVTQGPGWMSADDQAVSLTSEATGREDGGSGLVLRE